MGWDKYLRVWNLQKPKTPTLVLNQHLNSAIKQKERQLQQASQISAILKAQFSPDSRRILTASDDGVVRLWNVQTGTLLGVFPNFGPVRAIAFHPDAQKVLIATGQDKEAGAARIWRIPPYPEPSPALPASVPVKTAVLVAVLLALLGERLSAWRASRRLRRSMARFAPLPKRRA